MRLDGHVSYRDRREEAFRFHERHLGGRIATLARHGDVSAPATPAEWCDEVRHARVAVGGAALVGADVAHADVAHAVREPLREAARPGRHVAAAAPPARGVVTPPDRRAAFAAALAPPPPSE